MAEKPYGMRSQMARREQEDTLRRQEEPRRGLPVAPGPDRQTLERYQETLVRGEQGMQSMRREGDGERRAYGYEPRR